ncbi:HNH endonuclease [Microbacterium sp. HM58-2]|nr:HNH endonuclease [Microbacterium sp. HM58-2]
MVDATDSQMAMLADLVESLEAAEATLASMHAARDGLLALAGRLAVDIARQGDHPDGADMTIRTVAAEIGAVQRVSDRTVERRISQASWLVDGFPAVWQAQGAGRISAGHSHVIVEAGAHLTDAAERAAYAAAVLPLAETESPNRLRPLARRVAERFRERTIDERHRDARMLRRVWAADAEDGMGDLRLHGPAVLIHAMMDRLSQMAHEIRDENLRAARETRAAGDETFEPDQRTVDEIRADLLADLVLTGVPVGHDTEDGLLGEIRAGVEVTVPVTTLMGDDMEAAGSDEPDAAELDFSAAVAEEKGSPAPGGRDETVAGGRDETAVGDAPSVRTGRAVPSARPPAILDGVMPIDTETARRLAGRNSGWNRVLTHPVTGALLAVDRYRPSEVLKRHLRARDQRCRFPGCRIAARKCDLDHNHSASTGGATCDENLAAFCRRHHMLKHHSPWQVTPRAGGVLEWTSPTGRTYIDRPPPPHTVVFSEADIGRPDADLLASARPPF